MRQKYIEDCYKKRYGGKNTEIKIYKHLQK